MCQRRGSPRSGSQSRACLPPPPSRTDWTRLVLLPVLTGHVSSFHRRWRCARQSWRIATRRSPTARRARPRSRSGPAPCCAWSHSPQATDVTLTPPPPPYRSPYASPYRTPPHPHLGRTCPPPRERGRVLAPCAALGAIHEPRAPARPVLECTVGTRVGATVGRGGRQRLRLLRARAPARPAPLPTASPYRTACRSAGPSPARGAQRGDARPRLRPVLTGHVSSFPPYYADTSRPRPPT